MPREKITTTQYKPTDNPNVVDEVARGHVHIGFNRHGNWVQVGVQATVAELEDMLRAAREQAANDRGVTDPNGYPFIVWSSVIDRGETNNLIRQARRARDAAYGSDA